MVIVEREEVVIYELLNITDIYIDYFRVIRVPIEFVSQNSRNFQGVFKEILRKN